MCEVVTVLARDVDTCVARHPSGVLDNIPVSYLYFVFCWVTKVTRMCEVVTVLARGVGTCVARHPSGVPDNIRFPILFLGCYSHGSAYCETTFIVEMHYWCRWRSRIATLMVVHTICAVACPSGASTLPMQDMGASWLLAVTMTAGTQWASALTTHTHTTLEVSVEEESVHRST